jgi:hypothetical protein
VSRKRGNCYVTCEALYHLMGGRRSGWKPCTVRHEGDVHWFLVNRTAVFGIPVNTILDPTRKQFKTEPPYHDGRGRGFLTKKPSRRARELMKALLWQPVRTSAGRRAR